MRSHFTRKVTINNSKTTSAEKAITEESSGDSESLTSIYLKKNKIKNVSSFN